MKDLEKNARGTAFKVWVICNDALMNTDAEYMLDLSVESSNALNEQVIERSDI